MGNRWSGLQSSVRYWICRPLLRPSYCHRTDLAAGRGGVGLGTGDSAAIISKRIHRKRAQRTQRIESFFCASCVLSRWILIRSFDRDVRSRKIGKKTRNRGWHGWARIGEDKYLFHRPVIHLPLFFPFRVFRGSIRVSSVAKPENGGTLLSDPCCGRSPTEPHAPT